MTDPRPMRKGWFRGKLGSERLPDLPRRALVLKDKGWEWEVQDNNYRPLASGSAPSEPQAQAAAEAALDSLLTAALHELRGEGPA